MSFTFKGQIVSAEDAATGEGKKGPWAKRVFVVKETKSDYPQKAKFTLFKTGEYMDYATTKFPEVGSEVEVEFNLKLVEGVSDRTDKPYSFQELSAWKVINTGNRSLSTPSNEYEEYDSDLPFD